MMTATAKEQIEVGSFYQNLSNRELSRIGSGPQIDSSAEAVQTEESTDVESSGETTEVVKNY